MKYIFSVIVIAFLMVSGCDKNETINTNIAERDCPTEFINDDKVFYSGDRLMLYGGENSEWDFDVTNWILDKCRLRYGLGRESFDALIAPQYKTVEAEDSRYHPFDRFIILLTDGQPKVYPIRLMINHEVINEYVNGTPVMVVYCVLADLAAVYKREYCDTLLTFALSGYTYSDPDIWEGTDAFVLWDRETESLWWPLIDKAVSGEMLGTPMEKYTETLSWEITWGEIVKDYPDALVMATGQTMDPPNFWTHYEDVSCQ